MLIKPQTAGQVKSLDRLNNLNVLRVIIFTEALSCYISSVHMIAKCKQASEPQRSQQSCKYQ